jgi:hypothetical protein
MFTLNIVHIKIFREQHERRVTQIVNRSNMSWGIPVLVWLASSLAVTSGNDLDSSGFNTFLYTTAELNRPATMSVNPRALGGTGGAGVAWAVTDMPQSVICSALTIQLFRAQKAQPVCRANPPDDECVGEVFETRNLTAFNNPVFNPYRFSNRTDVMFCPPGYFCPVGLVCPISTLCFI